MIFKGSNAAERKGIYYVISDIDHPATTLMQSPNKLNQGMAARIGFSQKKARAKKTHILKLVMFNTLAKMFEKIWEIIKDSSGQVSVWKA